ncbi:MAG: hypothetical protein JWR52_367 [Marmoricola sp.]|nr:hypothetical protein [Marmoricola sp.]
MTEQPPSYDPNSQPPQAPAPPPPPPPWGQAPPTYGQVPPTYGQPMPGYYPQPTDTNGKATAALVLGIVGIFPGLFLCGPLVAIAAIIVGFIAKKDVDVSQGRVGGRSQAKAGIVLGFVGVGLFVLGVIGLVILFSNLDCSSVGNNNSYSFNCN